MIAMHEDVHEWADKQRKPNKDTEDVRPVLGK